MVHSFHIEKSLEPTVIHFTVGIGGAKRAQAPRSLMYAAWFMPRLSPEVSPPTKPTLGLRSPFSHQSCHIAPQRLCRRTPAVTLLPIDPWMPSSNSLHTPLWPPMLSTQNGFDSDRHPCVLSF